jgi:branched-chain amino acid transport system substrate-binding protein
LVAWLTILALVGSVVSCGGGGDKGSIKIGVEGPMTGQWALEGLGFRNAVTLLAEQVNAEGGLLGGRMIEIVEGDDRGDADEAGRVAQRLVDEGVIAVVGAYNSDASKAAAEVYDEAGVLQITPSSTATDLTQQGYERFMRVCFLDDRQGLFVAGFLTATMGKSKVALIHDDSLYAKGLAEWTQRYLEERGAETVYFGAITPGQRDFAPTIEALEESGAEAVYFTAYWREAGLLVKQMHETGMLGSGSTLTFVAGDAVNNPEFVQIAGVEAAAGTFISTSPLPQDMDTPEAKQFIADYEAKYGETPASIYTLMAADAFRLLVYAIEQTGSTEPGALSDYLHGVKDYPGITGTIDGYDEKGDRLGAGHVLYQVSETGEFVFFNP